MGIYEIFKIFHKDIHDKRCNKAYKTKILNWYVKSKIN